MNPSLEPRAGAACVTLVALKIFRKFVGVSRTSRLVWVSATLYGDGVRRRCATRCPRPLVDLLATQCPRLRRLSGSAVAPKLFLAPQVRGAALTFPVSPGHCPGRTPPHTPRVPATPAVAWYLPTGPLGL